MQCNAIYGRTPIIDCKDQTCDTRETRGSFFELYKDRRSLKSTHLVRPLPVNGDDKTNAASFSFEGRVIQTLLRRQGPRLGTHNFNLKNEKRKLQHVIPIDNSS